jgi:hypothetical protein
MGSHDHDKKPFWFNLYRLCYVLLVLLVNYVFQFMMLMWINDFVVQPSVHSVQDVYMQYHGLYFTEDGIFLQDVWDQANTEHDIRYKKDLCHMVFSQFYFLWFVLMMWTMIMVIEFRSNATLLTNIFKVPACPNNHPELMIQGSGGGFEESEYDDDKLLIVGLTPFVRILVFLFILIPKFFIGFFLMMLGMTWLSATESFSELMLNSLALEFVIRIDDHLFKALLPETYRQDMQKAMLNIPKFRKTRQQEIRADYEHWRTSTFYFVFFIVFTFLYLKYMQHLPIWGFCPSSGMISTTHASRSCRATNRGFVLPMIMRGNASRMVFCWEHDEEERVGVNLIYGRGGGLF